MLPGASVAGIDLSQVLEPSPAASQAGEGVGPFTTTGWAAAYRGWEETLLVIGPSELRRTFANTNGIEAQRPQPCARIGNRDLCIRAGVLRPVKGGDTAKAASRSVGGVVKPDAHMEGVSGRKRRTRIEAEDLVHKLAYDGNKRLSIGIDRDVRLIPGKSKSRGVLKMPC